MGPASLPPTLQLLHQWEAPEGVLGGVYGRLSAKKERWVLFFLTDAMFTHLFPSGLTNGLIIEPSPGNVISGSFGGQGCHFATFPTQFEP